MARTLHKLSAKTIDATSKPGRYSDGGNLYLDIRPTGAKSWVFMYRLNGRQREKGLGSVQAIPTPKVRAKAAELRALVADGVDPLDVQEPEKIPTFGECADAYIETLRPDWRNAKHAAQWEMTLRVYAKPFRSKSVDQVTSDDIQDVLEPLWKARPETASRLRGRIERVWDYARVKHKLSGENPARWRGHLDKVLRGRHVLTRGHHATLSHEKIPDFMARLREREAMAARALEFAILTAARSGEVLGARWDEIDLAKKNWNVPAERMKAGKAHRVPLSGRAIEILKVAKKAQIGDFIFPSGDPKKPLSNMSMAMMLRRMSENEITVHGFRSTFRNWVAEETPTPRDVAEMALAHTIRNKVEAAYNRTDLLEKRRPLMEAWAAYCEPDKAANVVPMKGHARGQ